MIQCTYNTRQNTIWLDAQSTAQED